MPSPKGDPTYIKDKDRFFMNVARTIAQASTHLKIEIKDGKLKTKYCKLNLENLKMDLYKCNKYY